MENMLKEKENAKQNFRKRTMQVMEDFLSLHEEGLTSNTISQLLASSCYEGVMNNNRINIAQLCQAVLRSEGVECRQQLQKHFTNRKEIKSQQLSRLLMDYSLVEIDLEEQICSNFFEGASLSLPKLDSVMKSLGYPPLNAKDKEILLQCFDREQGKTIKRNNIARLMHCQEPARKAGNAKV